MMEIKTLVPDKDILSELGRRLKKLRKQRGLNQDELAAAAGIGVATLRRIEDGQDSQLGSWIKLMKALDLLHAIDAWLPENLNSPMAEAARLGKAIRRRKAPVDAVLDPSADGTYEVRESSLWGDEQP